MNRQLQCAVAAAILAASATADAQRFPTSEVEELRQIRPSWSGSWIPEGQPGHGIHVEVLTDGRAVFYWITYDGNGNQLWLVALSDYIYEMALTGLFVPYIRIEATAYYADGLRFGSFDPDDVNLTEWGQITLTFQYHSCDNDAAMAWEPVVPGFSSGELELQRLTEIMECKDNELTLGGVWDVQLEFDGPKSTVEVEVVEGETEADLPSYFYEFTAPDNCVWSGEFLIGFSAISTQGERNCSGNIETYEARGIDFVEHELCVDDECTRLDQMLIFKEGSTQLIFTR